MVAVLVKVGRQRDASAAIERGLDLLRLEAERIGIDGEFDALTDVRALRTLRESLVPQLPPALRGELEARLEAAVRAENYELAAILRDELRRL
jgi:predicted NBD/HSP70 family sugar kinase